MNKPRSAGELGDEFPYSLPTMCYIEVSSDGTVSWGTEPETYERVESGESRLYAVWPGKWSSHLFAIDDLDQFARVLGLVPLGLKRSSGDRAVTGQRLQGGDPADSRHE